MIQVGACLVDMRVLSHSVHVPCPLYCFALQPFDLRVVKDSGGGPLGMTKGVHSQIPLTLGTSTGLIQKGAQEKKHLVDNSAQFQAGSALEFMVSATSRKVRQHGL